MTAFQTVRRKLSFSMIILLFMATLVPLNAQAGIVTTDTIVTEQQVAYDRDHLLQELNRSDVRAELERFGVNADHAQERVAAMTNAEVLELTAGLDQFAAGGGVSIGLTTILLLVLIWILVT